MSTAAAAAPPTAVDDRPRRRRTPRIGATPSKPTAIVILALAGVFFLLPLIALLQFSLSASGRSGITFAHWAGLFDPGQAGTYENLITGIVNSLVICLITVPLVLLILVPVMLLSALKYPKARRIIEFVCILPISVPTIVLVVGFVPVYQAVAGVFGSYSWTLSFAIGVIVLPYAYRPIQAEMDGVNMVVLSEAARSLGANVVVAVWRVLIPNLRRGIISAAFLTIAVVLGEFTIATFLSQTTFQTALFLLGQTDPYVTAIASLLSLVLVFVLLVVLGTVGSRQRRSS